MTRPYTFLHPVRTDADRVRDMTAGPLHPTRAGKRRFTWGQSLAVMALMATAFAAGVML